MDETRALLDALMGPNRNVKKEEANSGAPDFTERTICKNFLVGFCPHDWFKSTPKRSLQPCHKIHSELMKEHFEKHPEAEKYRAWWEEDFLTYLQPIARECDSYIVRERVKCRPKTAGGKSVRMPQDVKEKCDILEERYAGLVKQSEDAADSSLSASKEFLGQSLVLKEEIDTLKARYTQEFQGEDICEICGVKYPLGSGGAEWHDKESHKKGKTHQGYAQIRAKIDELIGKRKEWEKWSAARKREYEPMKEAERLAARQKEPERKKERPREIDRRDDRDRSRGRDRAKERDRKGRSRSKGGRDRSREKVKGHKAESRSASRPRRRDRAKSRSESRTRKQKDRAASAERSRSRRKRGAAKAESDIKKAETPKERVRSSPDRTKKSPSPPRGVPPAGAGQESSDEESQPEDEKDGITVLEEDLPEFWSRIQKLKADVRTEGVAALSSASKERLERWLLARVRSKAA